MRDVTVLNPGAGKGLKAGGDVYVTTAEGDCRRFVRETCISDPSAHISSVGGDGTLNEAVSGIMDAGAGDTATVTAIPSGSGNDTVKTADTYGRGNTVPVDLIGINDDRYCINMINIGFDCHVVDNARRYKKIRGISGNLSYILGVIRQFFRPFGENFRISATLEDGTPFEYEGPTLLCAVANGQWCGGSFHNSPLSDMRDGVVEMILVPKMSKLKFIRLVGDYKKAKLISVEKGGVDPRYADTVIYRRITEMTIEGCASVCTDGEVFRCDKARLTVLPHAIRYVVG